MNPTCCPSCGSPVLVNTPGSQGLQGPTGETGPTGAAGAAGAPGASLVWLGEWNSATNYVANNAASYNGSAWVALQPSTNVIPVAGAYWSLLAAQGATGQTGATGAVTISATYGNSSTSTFAVTTSAALLNLSPTPPVLVLASAGTYVLHARIRLDGSGLTANGQTFTGYLWDATNLLQVPDSSIAFELMDQTTNSGTVAELTFPVVPYALNAGATIQIWGLLSGGLGAGSLVCVEADLVAEQIA